MQLGGGRSPRRLQIHPCADLLLNQEVDRSAQFLIQFAFDSIAVHEVSQRVKNALHHSDLNASLASTRIARDTGTTHPASATAMHNPTAAINVAGSSGDTPTSS